MSSWDTPEHELLFVATQVARAAGLEKPSISVSEYRRTHSVGAPLSAIMQEFCTNDLIVPSDEKDRPLSTLVEPNSISLPEDSLGRALRRNTVLFSEAETYQMLLRSNAPQSS